MKTMMITMLMSLIALMPLKVNAEIAEDVIFLVEGEIARHRTDESEIPLQDDKPSIPR